MADWSDYYSGQRVDSLARCVELRHHDVRVGGSIPGLGSFNTVTFSLFQTSKLIQLFIPILLSYTLIGNAFLYKIVKQLAAIPPNLYITSYQTNTRTHQHAFLQCLSYVAQIPTGTVFSQQQYVHGTLCLTI